VTAPPHSGHTGIVDSGPVDLVAEWTTTGARRSSVSRSSTRACEPGGLNLGCTTSSCVVASGAELLPPVSAGGAVRTTHPWCRHPLPCCERATALDWRARSQPSMPAWCTTAGPRRDRVDADRKKGRELVGCGYIAGTSIGADDDGTDLDANETAGRAGIVGRGSGRGWLRDRRGGRGSRSSSVGVGRVVGDHRPRRRPVGYASARSGDQQRPLRPGGGGGRHVPGTSTSTTTATM
jgi:hypothetical protein